MLILLHALTGCGGGDSTNSQGDQTPDADQQSGENAQALNPDYRGYLYLDNYSHFSMLDLNQGLAYSLRTNPAPTSTSPDADTFVTYYEDFEDTSLEEWQLDWFGQDGMSKNQLSVAPSIRGVPKISDDGRWLALGYEPEYSSNNYLVVINQQGETIFQQQLDNQDDFPFPSWDWLVNGDLLFAAGSNLYRASGLENPAETEVTLIRQLPSWPLHIMVSPDQNQISFNMESADDYHHVYVMNLADGAIRQVTDSEDHEHGASWSPDGRYLAFNHGPDYLFCSGYSCIGDCPNVYIVSSDAQKIRVAEDDTNQAWPVRQYHENGIEQTCSREHIEWRDQAVPMSSEL